MADLNMMIIRRKKRLKKQRNRMKNYTEFLNESDVNENFPGVGETVNAKDINSDMKSYFNRTNRKLEITTKDNKKSNGSVNKFYNDLIFATKEKWDIPVKDILKVKILE